MVWLCLGRNPQLRVFFFYVLVCWFVLLLGIQGRSGIFVLISHKSRKAHCRSNEVKPEFCANQHVKSQEFVSRGPIMPASVPLSCCPAYALLLGMVGGELEISCSVASVWKASPLPRASSSTSGSSSLLSVFVNSVCEWLQFSVPSLFAHVKTSLAEAWPLARLFLQTLPSFLLFSLSHSYKGRRFCTLTPHTAESLELSPTASGSH